MLENLKFNVCKLNRDLPGAGLVVMTSGNVSGRDPQTGHIVIKPSGVSFDKLTPDDMIVLDIDGTVLEGSLKPSVDAKTHLYIYRHRSDIHGVVHTHSNYATAFAALGEPIPVYLTAQADEFGAEIPVGAFCPIGEEDIGREIVNSIGSSRAILMTNHGVFTVGKDAGAAFKSAVMVEDIAKTTSIALQMGRPKPIPESEVQKLHKRYTSRYGQK